MPDVIIIGAGPAGLTLAAELSSRNIHCLIIEKREQRSSQSRAFCLTPLTLELLDMSGIADQMVENGLKCNFAPLGDGKNKLYFDKLKTRFPYLLCIPQIKTEEILEAWALKAGASIIHGATLFNLTENDSNVLTHYEKEGEKHTLKSQYVIGCDGVNSTVRDLAMIDTTTVRYDKSLMHGDVRLKYPPPQGVFAKTTVHGMHAIFPLPQNDTYRAIVLDHARMDVPVDVDVDLAEFNHSALCLSEHDFGMHSPLWLQRFRSQQRHAKTYNTDRIFLVGDAAHTYLPAGGQGLQMSIHGALNLAWKLASVIQKKASTKLLDTYEQERRPLSDKIMRRSVVMFRYEISNNICSRTLKYIANKLLLLPFIQTLACNQLSGLTTHYASMKKGKHLKTSSLIGYKATDFIINSPEKKGIRLFEILRNNKFALLQNTHTPVISDLTHKKWHADLNCIVATNLFEEYSVRMCLIRPDGFIVWASRKAINQQMLEEILSKYLF